LKNERAAGECENILIARILFVSHLNCNKLRTTSVGSRAVGSLCGYEVEPMCNVRFEFCQR
jgi:hypothetical protein